MRNLFSIISCLLLASAGCGPDDLEPGVGDDPGNGTSTLEVDGTIHTSPRITNASSNIDFDTEFTINVRLNGQPVSTGLVRITSYNSVVDLVFDPGNGNGNNSRWRGVAAGYDEVYVLDVESGADNVRGVRVDGPNAHHFTSPAAGASVDSTMPLAVAWNRDDTADGATVRAEEVGEIDVADSGSYMFAPRSLRADRDQARENELRIERTNRLVPRGVAGTSELRVTIENRLTVVALPDPTL